MPQITARQRVAHPDSLQAFSTSLAGLAPREGLPARAWPAWTSLTSLRLVQLSMSSSGLPAPLPQPAGQKLIPARAKKGHSPHRTHQQGRGGPQSHRACHLKLLRLLLQNSHRPSLASLRSKKACSKRTKGTLSPLLQLPFHKETPAQRVQHLLLSRSLHLGIRLSQYQRLTKKSPRMPQLSLLIMVQQAKVARMPKKLHLDLRQLLKSLLQKVRPSEGSWMSK